MITPGLGFGSAVIAGGVMATGQEYQNPEQSDRARDIFCLDLIIQNPDRLPTNPNCMLKNGRFVAFDFNMAFSFLLLIGEAEKPWLVSKHQISEKHLFRSSLSGKNVDFRPFIDRVRTLSEQKITDLLEAVPFSDGRWNDRVRNHLMAVVNNADKLELEFTSCLR